MDGITEKVIPREEIIDCPFCREGKINITFIPSYISWNVSRIASGAKRTKFVHDPKTVIHNACQKCRKSKREIKDSLEGSGKILSDEERLKRLREAGLPTKIESKPR